MDLLRGHRLLQQSVTDYFGKLQALPCETKDPSPKFLLRVLLSKRTYCSPRLHVYIPKGHYSEGPFVRRAISPNVIAVFPKLRTRGPGASYTRNC